MALKNRRYYLEQEKHSKTLLITMWVTVFCVLFCWSPVRKYQFIAPMTTGGKNVFRHGTRAGQFAGQLVPEYFAGTKSAEKFSFSKNA